MSRRSFPPELQEDLTAGKKAAGRVSGQPETADCSGEEGMVAGGEGVGWKGCCCVMVIGSGLGMMGSAEAGRWGRREKRREKERMMGSGDGGCDISVAEEL